MPTLSINDVTITEGNSGTAIATFTVTLSAASAQTITVAYTTANGSATAGSDFTAVSGTLTFAPSTLTQTVGVTISGDATLEPTETFTINLANATNAAISDGSGLGHDHERRRVDDADLDVGGDDGRSWWRNRRHGGKRPRQDERLDRPLRSDRG